MTAEVARAAGRTSLRELLLQRLMNKMNKLEAGFCDTIMQMLTPTNLRMSDFRNAQMLLPWGSALWCTALHALHCDALMMLPCVSALHALHCEQSEQPNSDEQSSAASCGLLMS